jgi:hypothetical protein
LHILVEGATPTNRSPEELPNMIPKLYLRYSDLFDHEPTKDELIDLLRGIPIRHALYTLSSLNLCLRVAMQDSTQSFGKVQEKMLATHLDDECLNLLRQRFPCKRCEDRPVFLPECLLNVMRVVIDYGNPVLLPVIEEDQQIMYRIGRACLMVNSLLVSSEQADALRTGTHDEQRIELMTQVLSGFELANPPRADHLIPRLEIMYRVLLRTPEVKARIIKRSGGFDFEAEFEANVGVILEHWLFVVFTFYAYFLNAGSALDPDPNFMMINPSIFRGESGITEGELQKILAIVSASPMAIKTRTASVPSTDPRYDFVEYRSTPLIQLEDSKLVPTDLTFIVEKCHTGVHWALHDALLTFKMRQSLFTAWGELFQEYVHWLFVGMKTNLPVVYFPSPKWKDNGNESFDGILLKGSVMVPAEYKGGFIARDARYSGDSATFLADLDKKFAVGCQQLAEKIGAAFADDKQKRRELEDLDCGNVRAVVPVLLLQDHILRAPFLNWCLNKRFQEYMGKQKVRADVVVRPLTVLMIDDLESIIHSVESEDFDFVYALQNRTVRDPEALSGLMEWLSQFPDFGHKPSPRIKQVLDQVMKTITSFLFPGTVSP